MANTETYTKSLMSFKETLVSYEADYRNSAPGVRGAVIAEIIAEIREQSGENGVEVGPDEVLAKQIATHYTNHRSVPKEEGPSKIKIGKKWTGRLVYGELHRDAIKKTVDETGVTDPHERIALWSKTLTEKYNSLSSEERAQCILMAEQWNRGGAPLNLKRREAATKTGKYVQTALDQLWDKMNVHAVVLVTYQDEDGDIKISDFESSGIASNLRFTPAHENQMKVLRKEWGHWAKKTFPSPVSEETGEAAGESAPQVHTSPAERLLQKASDGSWELGPLADVGSVLRKDLGDALREYVTQQWRLKGGSKRVNWKSVAANNSWYISDSFLLPNKPFSNPAKLKEAALRSYWRHWLKLAKSGTEFRFKSTSPPGDESSSESDSDAVHKDKGKGRQEEVSERPESPTHEDPGRLTPAQCSSDEQRSKFLRDLCPFNDKYKAFVNVVAEMKDTQIPAALLYPAGCFSWDWSSIHADEGLHEGKIGPVVQWLENKPHLTPSGDLVSREALQRICLGVGIMASDAELVQFTEPGGLVSAPAFIKDSAWDLAVFNKLDWYIGELHGDILQAIITSSQGGASTGVPSTSKKAAAGVQEAEDDGVGEIPKTADIEVTRKSDRYKKTPTWHKDYDVGGKRKGKQRALPDEEIVEKEGGLKRRRRR